jgi:hypothetical protein
MKLYSVFFDKNKIKVGINNRKIIGISKHLEIKQQHWQIIYGVKEEVSKKILKIH